MFKTFYFISFYYTFINIVKASCRDVLTDTHIYSSVSNCFITDSSAVLEMAACGCCLKSHQLCFVSAPHPKGPMLLPKASVNGDSAPVIPEEMGTGTCLIMETDTPESDLSL